MGGQIHGLQTIVGPSCRNSDCDSGSFISTSQVCRGIWPKLNTFYLLIFFKIHSYLLILFGYLPNYNRSNLQFFSLVMVREKKSKIIHLVVGKEE